jgi:hypothetical protein
MIRRITLAAVLFVSACGDDTDSKPKEDASTPTNDTGKDAGMQSAPDAGSGAGPAVTPDVVTNVGKACRTENGCMGEGPACQTMLSLLGQQVPFPGGYCSAQCSDNRECGETGECPVGESLKAIPAALRSLIGGAAPSNCYERCTSNADCRTDEGYRCATIVSALSEGAGGAGLNVAGFDVSAFLSGPILDSKYCLPPAPAVPDAGAPVVDAGAPAVDAGVDAGPADAGASDAGSDAGHDL